MTEYCKTPNCESEAKCLGLCSSCYSYLYYWQKRTPKALMKRVNQIQMYGTRMDMLGAPTSIKHFKIEKKNQLSVIPGQTKFKNKRRKAS